MKRLYAIIILLLIYSTSFAQILIRLSTEKVKIDGQVFIVHNVQPKETLYSLSKAYNVSIDDILKQNTNATSGLKAGMKLYIPNKLQINNDTQSSQNQKELTRAEERKLRKIQKQKERIAKALKKQNAENAQKGNTDIKEPEHKIVDTLSIFETPTDTIPTMDTTIVEKEEIFPVISSNPVKIGMILPLDSKSSSKPDKNFMDFYAGALLALDKLSKQGIDVDFTLIDQNDYKSFFDIEISGLLNNKDLIIGPIKKREIEKLLPFAKENNSIILSPMDFDAFELADTNKNFVQIPTSLEYQLESLVDFVIYEYDKVKSNILVISESGDNDILYKNTITKLLDSNQISYNRINYTILQGRNIKSQISQYLKSYENNLVIVPSNNEAFISDVMRNLSLIEKNNIPIKLFGMPRWKNFEIIDVYLKHQLNLHLAVTYYVDNNDYETNDIIKSFRALFNTNPSPYAIQGYDIVLYMGLNLYNDKYFIQGNRITPKQLIQSNFNLIRPSKETGVVNSGTKQIIYNKDFTISVIE